MRIDDPADGGGNDDTRIAEGVLHAGRDDQNQCHHGRKAERGERIKRPAQLGILRSAGCRRNKCEGQRVGCGDNRTCGEHGRHHGKRDLIGTKKNDDQLQEGRAGRESGPCHGWTHACRILGNPRRHRSDRRCA